MTKIELEVRETHDIELMGYKFKITEPLLFDIRKNEQSEQKVGGTIDLLIGMGVPEELLAKLTSSETGKVCKQLLGLFEGKK